MGVHEFLRSLQHAGDWVVRPDFARGWRHARNVEGWTGRREAMALHQAVCQLPPSSVVVEVGSFLGRSSVVLANACARRGSGCVFCIDPFNGSGDDYSRSFYDEITQTLKRPQLEQFRYNLRRAGVERFVETRKGTAEEVCRNWDLPIDMLFVDGDQSRQGMRSAYDSFGSFLKPGGILAVHNSAEREYEVGHDGGRQLVVDVMIPSEYSGIYCVDTTTFGTKQPSAAMAKPATVALAR